MVKFSNFNNPESAKSYDYLQNMSIYSNFKCNYKYININEILIKKLNINF